MSLYSIIHDDPEIRNGLKARVVRPKIVFDRSIQAQPLTENYQIVGTAFDYLLRFFLQRVNGHAQTSRWVAEIGVELVGDSPDRVYDDDESCGGEISPRYREAAAYLRDAKRRHQAYLKSGVVTDELLVAALRLAYLDVARRVGPDRVDWVRLKSPDPKDAEDLRRLLALAEKQPLFKKSRLCALNPKFGAASMLVGGADADLVLDGCLIDIKTTKYPRLDPRDFYQLIGYYLLYGFDGIDCSDSKTTGHEINSLAIYFSRFGYLWKFSVDEVLPPDTVAATAKWFFESVCPSKADRLKYLGGFHGPLAKYLSESKKGAVKTPMPISAKGRGKNQLMSNSRSSGRAGSIASKPLPVAARRSPKR